MYLHVQIDIYLDLTRIRDGFVEDEHNFWNRLFHTLFPSCFSPSCCQDAATCKSQKPVRAGQTSLIYTTAWWFNPLFASCISLFGPSWSGPVLWLFVLFSGLIGHDLTGLIWAGINIWFLYVACFSGYLLWFSGLVGPGSSRLDLVGFHFSFQT